MVSQLLDRRPSLKHTCLMEQKRSTKVRIPSASTQERKRTLVKIAYDLIATKGLEGLRTRHVAEAAGIDSGTLHYHFSSKEALIQGVVAYLIQNFEKNRCDPEQFPAETALDELRREFEDNRLRLYESPEQYLVLSELMIRSSRNVEIATTFKRLDDGWYATLNSMLTRGVEEGVFRRNLDMNLCAMTIMATIRGTCCQFSLPAHERAALLLELAAQTEAWILADLKGPV